MRRSGKNGVTGTVGTLRVDSRSSRLVPRLNRGDIAVLDHVDLDGGTAQALLDRGVAAVVNAAPSSSGRYPNLGPALLVEAGVPLLDDVGPRVLTALRDGTRVRVDGDTVWVDETQVARGMRQDLESVTLAADLARAGVAAQLADLAGGAVSFLVDEQRLLLEGHGLPELATPVAGRTALVVGPAYGGADQLRELRRFVRRAKPLLVGVDGGADVLVAAGLDPDVLVGDPDAMSEAALRIARDVVLHEGAEGRDRLHELVVPAVTCATQAAAEDLALLLLHHGGASLVVSVGLPRTLEELLDRGRRAAASSLLTRFAVGGRFVQGTVVPALHRPRRRTVPVLSGVVGALVGAGAAVAHPQLLDLWRQLVG
ncbi:MAG TPA: putative cytokinetic ring protein SteA [Mycobacteriales bacterium]|nr:putative cytokinetic ring protein SteA [Mycobacteriales bacterium]